MTTPEMGIHGVIEFGNRVLGIAARPDRARLLHRRAAARNRAAGRWSCSSLVAGLGIPGQGVIGGITVLTDLNPWVVGLHFLLSMALIALAYALWQRTAEGDRDPPDPGPGPLPPPGRPHRPGRAWR